MGAWECEVSDGFARFRRRVVGKNVGEGGVRALGALLVVFSK